MFHIQKWKLQSRDHKLEGEDWFFIFTNIELKFNKIVWKKLNSNNANHITTSVFFTKKYGSYTYYEAEVISNIWFRFKSIYVF